MCEQEMNNIEKLRIIKAFIYSSKTSLSLRNLLNNGTTAERKLLNVLDWMGADAVPLVREHLQSNPKKAKNILAKIAKDHGIEIPK